MQPIVAPEEVPVVQNEHVDVEEDSVAKQVLEELEEEVLVVVVPDVVVVSV